MGGARRALGVLVGVGATLVVGVGQAAAASTVRVSVSSTGAQADGRSTIDAISPNGRFVLFDSWASNLVSGDTNGVRDVFLRDRLLRRTIRVSVGPGGRQGNGYSHGVTVSSDGRFILFVSRATNLTNQADRNQGLDVFVRDRLRAKTFRVSVRPRGGQFHDSPPFGELVAGGISDNGRWVAFGEHVWPWPEWPSQGLRTFVRDRVTHTTHRVTTPLAGVGGELPAALSGDGRWLTLKLLDDKGPNITGYAVHDRWSGRVTNVEPDIYHLYVGSAVTPDAHYLVTSSPNDTVDGYDLQRWNRVTNRTLLLLANGGWQYVPAGVSADGRYVAFVTQQPGLVPNDTNRANDLFRLDTVTSTIIRLSLTSSGAQLLRGVAPPEYQANAGMLSSDGRWAAFTSTDGRVVPNDTNHAADVFLHGPLN